MSKEKTKTVANPVGASIARPHFREMAQNKGITLIALIITIIVMLILVGVTVTVALNGGLFSTSKEAADETEKHAIQEQMLSALIYGENGRVKPQETYEAIESMFGDENVGDLNSEDYTFTVTGKNGTYTYKIADYEIEEVVESGEIPDNGGSGGTPVVPDTDDQGITIVPATYNVGDRVTIGDEAFYVIANDDETVTLLAEYCIVADEESEDYLKQSSTAESIAFSSTNYWHNEENVYPINLNDLEKYPIESGVTSVIKIAQEYGEKFEVDGVDGRLMTLEEIIELGGIVNEFYCVDTYECPDFVNGVGDNMLFYWLSDAWETCVLPIDGNSGLYSGGGYWPISYDGIDGSGKVRPVLQISKSAIQSN